MARDIQDSVRQALTSDAGRAIVATAVGQVIRNVRAERKVPQGPLGGLAPQRHHREVLLGVGAGGFVAGAGTAALTTVAVRRVRKLISRAPGALADAPLKAAGTVRAVGSRRGGATAARRRSAAESTTDSDRVEPRRAQAPAAGGTRGRGATSKTSRRSSESGNRGTKARRSSKGTSGGTPARTSRSATRSGARSASASTGQTSSASSRKSSGSSRSASRKAGAGQQKKASRSS